MIIIFGSRAHFSIRTALETHLNSTYDAICRIPSEKASDAQTEKIHRLEKGICKINRAMCTIFEV